MNEKIIGIVGGVGPYAGLDLVSKILDNTIADKDSDHFRIYHLYETSIPDRSTFLLHPSAALTNTPKNPAQDFAIVIKKLHTIGANIIAIPCNTAHSPQILEPMLKSLKHLDFCFVHIIHEVMLFIQNNYPHISKVGLLATKGTYHTLLYDTFFNDKNISIITPDPLDQDLIHDLIYNKEYGLKAVYNPVDTKVKSFFHDLALKLIKKKAELIILGCTEIPIAFRDSSLNLPLINPNLILARALISKVNPSKLKNSTKHL